MSKKFIALTLFVVLITTNACRHEQQTPQFQNRYYCYNDDDGLEIIFRKDGNVIIYYGIFREQMTGTYQCAFPKVSLQILKSDMENSDVSLKDEFLQNLDSLKFSANADTLYVFNSLQQGNSYILKLTPHNVFSHCLFVRGL